MTNSPTRLFTLAFLAVITFIAFVHAAWWLLSMGQGDLATFGDGDSYLRLIRIERLLETGNWYDITIPDANAPYGTTVHWTRLFDVVILAIAAPVMLVADSSTALFWAGMVVSPVVHLLLATAMVWALSPLLGARGACFAAVLTVTQAGILAFAVIGRADHHMMFILLSVMALGFVIRLTAKGSNGALMLGLTLGAGIWVGPEFLVFTLLVMIFVGLPWLTGIAGQTEAARTNLRLAVGLFGGLVAMLLIERGFSGFLTVEYDRLSIVHVSFAALTLLFWCFAKYANSQFMRWTYTVIGGLLLGGLMIGIFPKIIGNPLNDADPAILPIYAMISEYRAVSGFPRLLIYFGSVLFTLPWLVWRVRGNWKGPYHWVWLLLGAGLLIYVTFAVNWLRWSLYAALFMSIIAGDLIAVLDDHITRKIKFPARVPLKALTLFALSVGPLVTGASLLHASKTDEERLAAKENYCPVAKLSGFLNQSPLGDTSRTIVASANFGAEIIYRTDHKVVATVHHRSVDGILDGHQVLNGTDDAKITRILRERQVDLLILCPETSNDTYFKLGDDPGSLYKRLETDQVPDWLNRIALPEDLAKTFLLFSVHVDK